QLLPASATTGTALGLSADILPPGHRPLLLLLRAYWAPLPVSSKIEIIAKSFKKNQKQKSPLRIKIKICFIVTKKLGETILMGEEH
ncbi:hypothetical protein ACQP3D_29240, partial [Escherichia coli]